jgi:hypothetical protein
MNLSIADGHTSFGHAVNLLLAPHLRGSTVGQRADGLDGLREGYVS